MAAVHLNDNGINNRGPKGAIEGESETKLELLDIFGVDSSILAPEPRREYNRELKFHELVEERVRKTIAAKYDINNHWDDEDKTEALKNQLQNQERGRMIGHSKYLNT